MIDHAAVRAFLKARDEAEAAASAAKAAEKEHKQRQAELWEAMSDAGLKSLKIDVGEPWGEISLRPSETIRSKVLDKDALIEALEQSGRADEITKVDFKLKPLNELVRECLNHKIKLPDGLDFSSTKYITVSGR